MSAAKDVWTLKSAVSHSLSNKHVKTLDLLWLQCRSGEHVEALCEAVGETDNHFDKLRCGTLQKDAAPFLAVLCGRLNALRVSLF